MSRVLVQTHTMLGTPQDVGLIPRAVEQLFTAARELEASQGWKFDMKVPSLTLPHQNLHMSRISQSSCMPLSFAQPSSHGLQILH